MELQVTPRTTKAPCQTFLRGDSLFPVAGSGFRKDWEVGGLRHPQGAGGLTVEAVEEGNCHTHHPPTHGGDATSTPGAGCPWLPSSRVRRLLLHCQEVKICRSHLYFPVHTTKSEWFYDWEPHPMQSHCTLSPDLVFNQSLPRLKKRERIPKEMEERLQIRKRKCQDQSPA
jgi:hypothetical protein